MTKKYLLSPEALYHASDLAQFHISSTADLDPLSTVIGQERALSAIDLGLDMTHGNFNLYVMGSTGLGRHTIVHETLQARAEKLPRPDDWCYVANHEDPGKPRSLRMAAGVARELHSDLQQLPANQSLTHLEKKYHEHPEVLAFLSELEANIDDDSVNIVVDNSETRGAPVVYEDNPTYQNLMGRIEHQQHQGTLATNFSLIKAGSLLKANGGFLILDSEKLLADPQAWEGLKRVLKAGELHIQSPGYQSDIPVGTSLEPQPIPIDLKIVMIGSRQLFYLLKEIDPEFSQLFKIAADFAEEIPREKNNELLYARLIATLQSHKQLREIERAAIERILEHSTRHTWSGDKLSLQIGSLLDLLREADHHASHDNSLLIRREDIQAAIDAQKYRSSQLQEQLLEEMLEGTLHIDTEGIQLAQINGLSILQAGDYAFGIPTRISATARMGGGELIDIERESEQGGPIHSKGILILSSYLGMRYAKHQPLSLSASLVFEQTYGPVEGDSASAAELCALISAIADIPIKQSLAITGSVNQHGQMQAIGGVCEKIEGFFDLCNKRGLTGKQGVIIPGTNVAHLMLKQELIDAAAAGTFHIYAVDHVEHALELLTDLPAGQPDHDGIFPKHSFNYLVLLRLAEWNILRQQYAGQGPTATEQ